MAKSYDPITELRKRVEGRKLREFARSVPCSAGFMSDVLSGRRQPSDEIIAALGLERVVTYRKAGKK
jgi:hypothetical protein